MPSAPLEFHDDAQALRVVVSEAAGRSGDVALSGISSTHEVGLDCTPSGTHWSGASAMPLNTARLRRYFFRALRGPVGLESLAERRWTICPAELSRVPPAIYLEGSIERIRGLSQWRNWEAEMRMINGDCIEHAAAVGHLVRGVDLVGGYLYKNAYKKNPGIGAEKLWLRGPQPLERIAEADLVTTNGGSHFFGCWLLDDIPLSLLSGACHNKIAMVGKYYPHEEGYRQLLDEAAARIVVRARIERLVLYTDFGQNRSREERYRVLRARLRAHLRGSPADAPAGVYLKRGHTGEPRVIVNEDAVEALMRRMNFRIVEPELLSAEEIARQTLDARMVVSCEGSHISNVIYSMADDACLVVLQPPDRFSLAYKEFTDRMSMRFAFIIGQPSAGGFTVVLDELARAIDLVARGCSANVSCVR